MCTHEETALAHRVIRLTEKGKPDQYRLELKLKCSNCGMDFFFKTPEMGLLPDQPTTGSERLELRVPLEPNIFVNN